jgi:hypothetical protein
MKSNAPPNIDRTNDFVLQNVDDRCYIHHLPTQTVFYVHSKFHTYPENIDESRYHHPVRSEPQSPEFFLVITHTLAAPSIVWMIVLTTESWFRKEGLALFHKTFSIGVGDNNGSRKEK